VRILLVDDSPAVRSRLVARLGDAGLEVVGEADTGAIAITLARELRPDAIVCDVLLRDHQGLDLIPALREAAPLTRLVIFTNAPAYRRHCLALGVDAFLDKSADFDAVAAYLISAR
jgi:DNA-binding NarL/FixJ family response regulator